MSAAADRLAAALAGRYRIEREPKEPQGASTKPYGSPGVEPTIKVADFSDGSTRPLTRGSQSVYRAGRIIILRTDGSVRAAGFDVDRLSP